MYLLTMNCLILSLTIVDAVKILFTAENIFPSNVVILLVHRMQTKNYCRDFVMRARAPTLAGWLAGCLVIV